MTLIPRRGHRAARLGATLVAASATALAIGAPVASAAPIKPGPGWHRSAIPVKGMANLTSVVSPTRTQAWAGGFKVSSLVGHPSTERGDLAGTVARRSAVDICQEERKMMSANTRSRSPAPCPPVPPQPKGTTIHPVSPGRLIR